MGIVVSLAVAGAIFQNRAFANVARILPDIDRSILRSAIAGSDSTYFGGFAPEQRKSVIEGIVEALRDIYIVVIIAGACVVLLALFLPVSDFQRQPQRDLELKYCREPSFSWGHDKGSGKVLQHESPGPSSP